MVEDEKLLALKLHHPKAAIPPNTPLLAAWHKMHNFLVELLHNFFRTPLQALLRVPWWISHTPHPKTQFRSL